MVTVKPFRAENTYLAMEFFMKDPYKNTRMASLLEDNKSNSSIVYDNGVIKGILAISTDKKEAWFYGNRNSFKAAVDILDSNEFALYIDSKNLDIALSKFKAEYIPILVMRLKIRDCEDINGDARRIEKNDERNYVDIFGDVPDFENTFIKIHNGSIAGSASVMSENIKACSIGCLKYSEGDEGVISDILYSILNEYKSRTENMVIYAAYKESLKTALEKLGFVYAGQLLKLYKIEYNKSL
jgi:hypothetical protein